jgi:hypothetical protein
MEKYKSLIIKCLALSAALFAQLGFAQEMPDNGIGQTIQIQTRLHSFVGKPAWLIIIRDIDHNENLPYLYDFTTGTNYWITLTYGIDYLVTASELTFNPYGRTIKDFCNLESMGHIERGISMVVDLSGDLTPNTASYRCHIMKFKDSNFTIATPR